MALPIPRQHDPCLRALRLWGLGQMEEIVNLVIYLGSDDSRFMTGSELVIDGGSTAGLPGV